MLGIFPNAGETAVKMDKKSCPHGVYIKCTMNT